MALSPLSRHSARTSSVWTHLRILGSGVVVGALCATGATPLTSATPFHPQPTQAATLEATQLATEARITSLDGVWGGAHAFPHRTIGWVSEPAPLDLVGLPAYFLTLPAPSRLSDADHQSLDDFQTLSRESRAIFAVLGANFRLHILTNVGLLEATHTTSSQLLIDRLCPESEHESTSAPSPILGAQSSDHQVMLDRGRRSPVSALLVGEQLEREELAFVRAHPSNVPEIAIAYGLFETQSMAQLHSIELHLGVARADASERATSALRPDLENGASHN